MTRIFRLVTHTQPHLIATRPGGFVDPRFLANPTAVYAASLKGAGGRIGVPAVADPAPQNANLWLDGPFGLIEPKVLTGDCVDPTKGDALSHYRGPWTALAGQNLYALRTAVRPIADRVHRAGGLVAVNIGPPPPGAFSLSSSGRASQIDHGIGQGAGLDLLNDMGVDVIVGDATGLAAPPHAWWWIAERWVERWKKRAAIEAPSMMHKRLWPYYSGGQGGYPRLDWAGGYERMRSVTEWPGWYGPHCPGYGDTLYLAAIQDTGARDGADPRAEQAIAAIKAGLTPVLDSNDMTQAGWDAVQRAATPATDAA